MEEWLKEVWQKRSGLPAHLTTAFKTFLCGRLCVIGQCKVSQKNRGPEPEEEGGDGVLRQGHRGEGLLVVQLQDQGCRRRWQPFHWMSWFLICSSAIFLVGWFLAVLCEFVKRFLKFRIYSCHPVYLGTENLGLFRFVTKQFCLFRLFRYRLETPKQTEICCFWFHETNRNKRETDLV